MCGYPHQTAKGNLGTASKAAGKRSASTAGLDTRIKQPATPPQPPASSQWNSSWGTSSWDTEPAAPAAADRSTSQGNERWNAKKQEAADPDHLNYGGNAKWVDRSADYNVPWSPGQPAPPTRKNPNVHSEKQEETPSGRHSPTQTRSAAYIAWWEANDHKREGWSHNSQSGEWEKPQKSQWKSSSSDSGWRTGPY